MGRLEKQKRQLIEESNKRMLNEVTKGNPTILKSTEIQTKLKTKVVEKVKEDFTKDMNQFMSTVEVNTIVSMMFSPDDLIERFINYLPSYILPIVPPFFGCVKNYSLGETQMVKYLRLIFKDVEEQVKGLGWITKKGIKTAMWYKELEVDDMTIELGLKDKEKLARIFTKAFSRQVSRSYNSSILQLGIDGRTGCSDQWETIEGNFLLTFEKEVDKSLLKLTELVKDTLR